MSFNNIRTVKIDSLKAYIQFVHSPDNSVAVFSDEKSFQNFNFSSGNGVLYISAVKDNSEKDKLTIFVPKNCNVAVSVWGASRVFFPVMQSSIKATLLDRSQLTIDGAKGLVLNQKDSSQVNIKKLSGKASINIEGSTVLSVEGGNIDTLVMSVGGASIANISSSIRRLKLNTSGKSVTQLYRVTENFVWESFGVESVIIKNLYGNADLTARYNSKFLSKNTRLNLLLAASASTAKIEIKGRVVNANLQSKGASEISIDRVTGKVLGKSQRSVSKIRILDP